MSRRGENIRKRKDGRWEARMICGYDSDGKAKYRSIYGRSYQEVKEKKYARIGQDQIGGESGHQKNKQMLSLEDLALKWLTAKKGSVKESTYANYQYVLERYILPDLGKLAVADLMTEEINRFLREKLQNGRADGKGGLSAKTVSDIRAVLIMVVTFAGECGYPRKRYGTIFYPRNEQPAVSVLSRTEQEQLEEYIFQNMGVTELGILISLYGGLRIGEVCALQWGDFQFDHGTVTIMKTILRIRDIQAGQQRKTKVFIDRPKTETSNRVIPLPTFLMDLLKQYQKESDIFLLTGQHKYIEPRVYLDQYKGVLAKAKLEDHTFHTLRHTFATRCVESGFDTKSLSEILGHANVNTTLQRYVHPPMTHKKEQMERLAAVSVIHQRQHMDPLQS